MTLDDYSLFTQLRRNFGTLGAMQRYLDFKGVPEQIQIEALFKYTHDCNLTLRNLEKANNRKLFGFLKEIHKLIEKSLNRELTV